MNKIITLVLFGFLYGANLYGQAAYFEPGPAADVTDVIKLYVDVSSPDCGCPNLVGLDESVTLYMWTWEPGDPPGGNGSWDASNSSLAFTYEGPNLYSFSMIPTDFYGVDPPTVYSVGISFLIKKFNGADVDGNGEGKSVDFHLDILPVGCVNTLCAFPEVFREDDYLTMIYNNNKEENSGMQDLPEDDCYMYPVAVAGGVNYPYLSGGLADPGIVDHPELQMKYEGNGVFYTTILSDTFFRELSANPVPEGVPIEKILIRYRKAVFGPFSPNYELLLQCE
jgi:hypothetical protein